MTDWITRTRVEDRAVDRIAQEYVLSGDSSVQESALLLMATQPPSPESLRALISGLFEEGTNSELIAQAMIELQRYTSAADIARIDQALAQAMETGTPFVAGEVSARILPFLTDWSISFFTEVARRLPEGSIYRDNLSTALKSFQH